MPRPENVGVPPPSDIICGEESQPKRVTKEKKKRKKKRKRKRGNAEGNAKGNA
jgi:hypothetical protein